MNKESRKRVEKRTDNRNSIGRVVIAAILGGIQVWWVIFMILNIEDKWPWVSTLITLITVFVLLGVYCRRINSASKIAWMIVIIALPILGLTLYLLMGRHDVTRRTRNHFSKIEQSFHGLITQDQGVLDRLKSWESGVYSEFHYIFSETSMPVWQNTELTYFPDTVDALRMQLKMLEEAKHFIFMEYYAIEDLESFKKVKQILKEKADQGVEVRLIYDEIGSIGFLTQRFISSMKALGVDCRVFNPVVPVINLFMNNRDHRKIMVIDNEIGFTGGYNLANEYFHVTQPYGYWKDTGIMLRGDAVQNYTKAFLEMWNAIDATDTDIALANYLKRDPALKAASGMEGRNSFVQPYLGTPLRNERVAEEVYMNVLRRAETYAYFVSPYLVITDEMSREFTSAAKRGIDVRIIVPGIPDKKTVYWETKSFIPQLIRGGVRIFIYTPGFCHAKMCVSDDKISIVGTINLDYRSLYHHFENAVLMCDKRIALEIRNDFEEMFSVSREITSHDMEAHVAPYRFGQAFLRLIAPLL